MISSDTIIDTHAHYDDEKFDLDRAELLSAIASSNISRIVNMGASMRGARASLDLANRFDYFYAALGIHPENVEDFTEENFAWIKEHALDSKVVAVGEIGLDYYYEGDEDNRNQQKDIFIKQLELAKSCKLPVVIHSRDACEDTMSIMKAYGTGEGVIHCFSYSKEIAIEYIKMGYFIGVGGVVTFKNAKKLVETVEAIDLNHIVLETDCPYLAPVPHRGERNDSRYLNLVADRIAQIKNVSVEEVISTTNANAYRLYKRMK